jgi:trehalose 6-phosphate synthase
VLVVSNRQPYRHEYADDGDEIRISRPTGGLTAALDRALRGTDAAWIAWGDGDADPDVVDTKTRITVRRWAEAMLDGTTGGDRR